MLSLEDKEGLLLLLALLVHVKIELNDEEGILASAKRLEEEANMKAEDGGLGEEERENWERVEDAANKLIRVMKKKKGEKSTLSGIEKEQQAELQRERKANEEEKKKREAAEERIQLLEKQLMQPSSSPPAFPPSPDPPSYDVTPFIQKDLRQIPVVISKTDIVQQNNNTLTHKGRHQQESVTVRIGEPISNV